MVPWLRLHVFTVERPGSIPGQGTKFPLATWPNLKKRREREKEKETRKTLREALVPPVR